MSIVLQNHLFNSTYRIKFNPTKSPKFSIIQNPFQSFQFNKYPLHKTLTFPQIHHFSIKSYEQHQLIPSKSSSFDDILSLIELLCVVPSMVISVGCFVNHVYFKQHNAVVVVVGKRVLLWLLVAAVVVGSILRRRRVYGLRAGFENGSVVERVEKLEESMRSVSSLVRMLSRQLEKLGVRFKVTRKSIKHPISETAALAQKNSEATRALAMREEILEKELGEVQNVLLAMQEQQQKQLELILAIAKSAKLLESKRVTGTIKTVSNIPAQVDGQPIQTAPEKRTPSQVTGANKTVSKISTQVDGQPIQTAPERIEATNNNVPGS
ncbi:hypothetical protein vseg_005173 [Gypsophila vaccaria]